MTEKKLRSKKGETLVETLIAVLICCLALAALSTVMSSAGNMMKTSADKFDAYYVCNESLSYPNGQSGKEGTVTVSLKKGSVTTQIPLGPSETGVTTIPVTYFVNLEAGTKNPVASYYSR